jgi:hypothetical protein
MYRTCVIGPTILVTTLANDSGLLDSKSKVIFVSSESGSITLRHEKEGGGNYGSVKPTSFVDHNSLCLDIMPARPH